MRVIQCLYGVIPKDKKDIITECMASVKEVYPQVEVIKFPKTDVPLYKSSKWRWELLQQNDDILYVDWDVKLTKPLVLKNDGKLSVVYFMKQPDDCLVYSPKKEIFIHLENERKRRGITFTVFGWHRKVMRDFSCNEILTGPEYGVEHLRISGLDELRNQYGKLEVK
jgi:hypothetical protein